jgi:hypothetical protein
MLSGILVQATDGPFAREVALIVPFWVATAGALILGLAGWRALGRGFTA